MFAKALQFPTRHNTFVSTCLVKDDAIDKVILQRLPIVISDELHTLCNY